MKQAYNAKLSIKIRFYSPPPFFISAFLFFFICFNIHSSNLTYNDIPYVMNNLFAYHIDEQELTPELLQRMVKIYIEQFDLQKIYLLENETADYHSISYDKAQKIIKQMHKNDYSYFLNLNKLFKNSIERSQETRPNIRKKMLNYDFDGNEKRNSNALACASTIILSPKDLTTNLENKIERFFIEYKKYLIVDSEERKGKLFDLFEKKLSASEIHYLSEDENANVLRILKAFAKSLDSHTSFFSEKEALDLRINLEKQFEGIGVVLTEGIDGIIINEIVKNSPAEKCTKIIAGDIIVAINDTKIADVSFEEALSLLKTKNKITLTCCRIVTKKDLLSPSSNYTVILKPAPISLDDDRLTYSYERFGDGIIGKLDLKAFYENNNGVTSENDIRKAILELKKKGKIKGMVLDFRENSGGFLTQAIKVSGIFISNGIVAISKYKDNNIRLLRSINSEVAFDGPLIILISKLSASAAEIVAQTLQDYGIALIAGDTTSFGKGSIQYQTITDENSKFFLKVTIGRYYTVSGKSTQIEGVKSDIEIPTIFYPYPYGEKYLDNPLPYDSISSYFQDPLTDVSGKIKNWLEKNYSPNIQKETTTWRDMIPLLQKNSTDRLEKDNNFQLFCKKNNLIKKIINEDSQLMLDDTEYNYGEDDIQMTESINIIKDMIYINTKVN